MNTSESYSVPALLRAIEEHRNPTYFPGCHYVDQILERAAEIFASTDGVSGQRCECCDAIGLHDCPANPKTRAAEIATTLTPSVFGGKTTHDLREDFFWRLFKEQKVGNFANGVMPPQESPTQAQACEPVAWRFTDMSGHVHFSCSEIVPAWAQSTVPLYTHPPAPSPASQREWNTWSATLEQICGLKFTLDDQYLPEDIRTALQKLAADLAHPPAQSAASSQRALVETGFTANEVREIADYLRDCKVVGFSPTESIRKVVAMLRAYTAALDAAGRGETK